MDELKANQEAVEKAMRFAASPEAQQLKTLLQQKNAKGLKKAMEQAAQGDMVGAKATIEVFLATEDGKELLAQLRKNP